MKAGRSVAYSVTGVIALLLTLAVGQAQASYRADGDLSEWVGQPTMLSGETRISSGELIYDDWWRRWRVQEYDVLLETPTQFERSNRVRYAAVIYSVQDIAGIFSVRNQLIAAVDGTAVAAGLCAYHRTLHVYPDKTEKTYGMFVRKLISDIDPFDEEFGELRYRLLSARESIETLDGRLRLEAGQCILYSNGQDHQDGHAREHSDDGAAGDLVLWPPIKALAREQKLVQ